MMMMRKPVQGIFLVVVLVVLFVLLSRTQTSCPHVEGYFSAISTTTTSTTTLKQQQVTSLVNINHRNNNNDNNDNNSFYTRPISDRVPAEGIETILATSGTKPPFHFFAYPKTTDIVTEGMIATGIYEQNSTTALIDAIVCTYYYAAKNNSSSNEKPLLVLDLGANIGFHSLHMASCGARVISFEASPDTAWLLRSSAKLNGLLRDGGPLPQESHTMTIVPRGVYNTTSTARLSRHVKSPGMTSFVSTTPFELKAGTKGTALDMDIPLVRAQDVLEEFQINPDKYNLRFLKVDVEGFELFALQGLNLSKFPVKYLTFEFFPALLKAGGTEPTDLLLYIWKQGYRYLQFDGQKKLEEYHRLETGTTEAEVRTWAQELVQNGYERENNDFHVNMLAQRVK